ncbi:molybdate ABC transporter permease subunit [Effusibacillus dendaii]|uniref:Molybdenum transport system permease n=1 Tax=Effusibacillus dendaii TaxID=2743772 RepID=A0A7I8DCK6_9BACL|nr:molybdate ABC transporter permease subunit [Effusibacillus dendaii]BCJ86250.1 putative molybdenum transport system permease protein YvgM [Effusibacillus dendaii]
MDFWSPVVISVQVTLLASVIAFAFAIVFAWGMARRKFKGKLLVETILMLPLVLPPTVIGFGLLFLFGKNSWLGHFIEWLFGVPIVFTWWAAVVAAAVVAFPLVYQTLKTGFESVNKDLEDTFRSAGASEWLVFRHITLPLAWRFLLSGYMFGFARGIGEFGATLMFAGVIPGKTETIPTAIYMASESGNIRLASYWILSIMVLSFLLLSSIHKIRRPEYEK